jgi:hypothetical protein
MGVAMNVIELMMSDETIGGKGSDNNCLVECRCCA